MSTVHVAFEINPAKHLLFLSFWPKADLVRLVLDTHLPMHGCRGALLYTHLLTTSE